MKNVLLICLFFSLVTYSFAQRIRIDKTDEFTGARTIATSIETVTGIPQRTFFLAGVTTVDKTTGDSVKTISLLISAYINEVTSIDQTSSIYLKLDNDSVIELKHVLGSETTMRNEPVQAVVNLPEDVQEKLLMNKVIKIRIETSQKNIDMDLKQKHSEALINMIKLCKQKLNT
jgi:hypothetical protein